MNAPKSLLLIGSITAVMAGVAFLAGHSSRTARLMSSRNNLKQVARGIHNYVAAYERLPPHALHNSARQPIHSWRTLVTPFLAAVDQLYRWDEPWDGTYNRRLAYGLDVHIDASPLDEHGNPLVKTMGPYGGPMDYAWPFRTAEAQGQTDYRAQFFAIVGDDTAWPEKRALTFDDVTDGVENTIILAESHNLDAYWSQPVDLNLGRMSFTVNDTVGPAIGSPRDVGPLVAFADGAVFYLNPEIPSKLLRALLTANGGERIERSQLVRDGWLR